MIELSKHYTAPMLLRYTLPMMAMMLVSSIYGIVDGLFVSNVAGKEALASVTIVMPFVMVLSTVGMMMGSGGSAIVGQLLGAKRIEDARSAFSLIVSATFGTGVLAAFVGIEFMESVTRLLGASDDMVPLAVAYGRTVFLSMPMFMLQYVFEMFSATSGKPGLGLLSSVVAGVVNIALDALLIYGFGWGIMGAAVATCAAEYAAGILMLILFACGKAGILKLVRPSKDVRILGRAAINGVSEMVGMMAMSAVAMAYNLQLMSLYGENGVAAYAIIEYAGMLIGAALGGFSEGLAPLMSYQHGACNVVEKRSLFKKGFCITVCIGCAMFAIAQLLAVPLAFLFTSYDANLMSLTVTAFRIYSVAYLFMGFTYFGSSMFTSVENGKISAIIAFVHTVIFEIGSVMLLPMIFGAAGIWWSIVVAEVAATILSGALLVRYGNRYGWIS